MKEKPTGSANVVLRDRSKASLSCSFGVDQMRFL